MRTLKHETSRAGLHQNMRLKLARELQHLALMERNLLFHGALVKDHSDNERGNQLAPFSWATLCD